MFVQKAYMNIVQRQYKELSCLRSPISFSIFVLVEFCDTSVQIPSTSICIPFARSNKNGNSKFRANKQRNTRHIPLHTCFFPHHPHPPRWHFQFVFIHKCMFFFLVGDFFSTSSLFISFPPHFLLYLNRSLTLTHFSATELDGFFFGTVCFYFCASRVIKTIRA